MTREFIFNGEPNGWGELAFEIYEKRAKVCVLFFSILFFFKRIFPHFMTHEHRYISMLMGQNYAVVLSSEDDLGVN